MKCAFQLLESRLATSLAAPQVLVDFVLLLVESRSRALVEVVQVWYLVAAADDMDSKTVVAGPPVASALA